MTVSAFPLQPVDPPQERGAMAHGGWPAASSDIAALQIVQAIGARIWGADGAEYIDFDNAGGAVLLGHRDPAVIAAVRMARSADERRGPDRYWGDLSTLVLSMMPGSCRQFTKTDGAQFATQRLLADRDTEFIKHPLCQVD